MSMGSARRSGRRREASLVVLSDSDDAPSRKRRRDEKASDAKKTPSRASTNKGSRSKRSRVSSDSSDSDEIVYVVASRAASTASTSNTTHKSKQPKVGPSTLARKSTAPKRRNIEEEVPEVTPRKLVNGDGAAAVRSSQDNGVKRTPGSSFKERLKENEKSSPRFSQSFIGKAKSRNNHSIPLQDSRFESDPDAEETESEGDIPEARPSTRKQKSRDNDLDDFVVDDDKVVAASETDDSLPPLPGLASKTQSSPKRLKRKAQSVDTESEESEEVTFLKSSQGRKDVLSQYASQRREKEKRSKQKHRVVASPSPDPDASMRQKPIFQSDPNVTPPSTKRRSLNVRGISNSRSDKKRRRRREVMSGNDSSEEDDDDFLTDEAPPDPSEFRRQNNEKGSARRRSGPSSSQVKAPQKRHRHDSASSSSSSSGGSLSSDGGRLASGTDSEGDNDLVKEIELDVDPRRKEKLRLQNTKIHDKFAKYRQAQEKKIKREVQRKRNVVESDDEAGAGAKDKESSSDGSTDDGKKIDLDGEEEDFIVEDEDMDEYDRSRQEMLEDSLLPVEFSKHGKMDLEGHFKAFVKYIVLLYFFPNNKRLRTNERYQFSIRTLRNATGGLVDGAVASSIWQERFRRAVDTRPDLYMEKIHRIEGCEGCNKHDRTASWRAHLTGKRYDPQTFEDEDGRERPEQTFDLGRFCADKASMVHRLLHVLYATAATVRSECEERDRLPRPLPGDSDERRRRKDKEADRITKELATGKGKKELFPLTTQLWHTLRDTIDEAGRFLQQR